MTHTPMMSADHRILLCDATTGHTVYPVAYCDTPERAAAFVRAVNGFEAMREALCGLANALECEPGPRGVMDLVPGALEKARAALKLAEAE